jgi:predicted Rossmann fold nucleotide-binding protein DprA/Smf involved in DNA uptake
VHRVFLVTALIALFKEMPKKLNELPVFMSKKDEQILSVIASRIKGLRAPAFTDWFNARKGCFPGAAPGAELSPQYETVLLDTRQLERAATELSLWERQGIRVMSILSEDYPPLLKQIYDPPLVLYYRGTLSSSFYSIPVLAMVGARQADSSAMQIAADFAQALTQRGNCIISGLAYGIDAAAHTGALRAKSGFPTIAVLGSGADIIYPQSHQRLAGCII